MEHQRNAVTFDPKARTVVVIAGAAARGPYEAGALAKVLPALFGNDLSNVVLIGTSAGAINAALWGAGLVPNAKTVDVGESVKAVWRSIKQRNVFVTRSAVFALGQLFVRGLGAFFVECGCDWLATHRLLNTNPLRRVAQREFDDKALKNNVDAGRLLGVGVVATSCPRDGSGGRSRVFLYGPALEQSPALLDSSSDSSIDYVHVAGGLKVEHVLASAAIPVAFRSVEITEPPQYAGWYTDGGVRLNTPIRPALDLDASQLVVISSFATSYPQQGSSGDGEPNIFDVGAQAIHVVMGDGTIEDLRALHRINDMVVQAQNGGVVLKSEAGRAYRVVKFLTISPPNSELSVEGDTKLDAARRDGFGYRALSAVLSSAGPRDRDNELASFLLFYPPYAERQFELAARDVDAKGSLRDAFMI